MYSTNHLSVSLYDLVSFRAECRNELGDLETFEFLLEELPSVVGRDRKYGGNRLVLCIIRIMYCIMYYSYVLFLGTYICTYICTILRICIIYVYVLYMCI